MTAPSEIERLHEVAAGLAAAHPLVTRLLLLNPGASETESSKVRQWLAVLARRDRKAEADLVRAIEAASAPAEVFIVDERSYRIRERSASMAAALRRAVTLYVRREEEPPGRSP
ncbi:MAG TPA: hypothetical protein VNM43_11750 [Dehalococcoidia bacterium]|nr:hypothetical protein [Dehalococcoidia bacterium]